MLFQIVSIIITGIIVFILIYYYKIKKSYILPLYLLFSMSMLLQERNVQNFLFKRSELLSTTPFYFYDPTIDNFKTGYFTTPEVICFNEDDTIAISAHVLKWIIYNKKEKSYTINYKNDQGSSIYVHYKRINLPIIDFNFDLINKKDENFISQVKEYNTRRNYIFPIITSDKYSMRVIYERLKWAKRHQKTKRKLSQLEKNIRNKIFLKGFKDFFISTHNFIIFENSLVSYLFFQDKNYKHYDFFLREYNKSYWKTYLSFLSPDYTSPSIEYYRIFKDRQDINMMQKSSINPENIDRRVKDMYYSDRTWEIRRNRNIILSRGNDLSKLLLMKAHYRNNEYRKALTICVNLKKSSDDEIVAEANFFYNRILSEL